MKRLREYIILNESREYSFKPSDKEELQKFIRRRIREQGPNCNLNDIDVSEVDDMSWLFENSTFNGDISQWDVSNVKNMDSMFYKSKFHGDISKWDVSNVKSMYNMFENSPLDGKEPSWYKE